MQHLLIAKSLLRRNFWKYLIFLSNNIIMESHLQSITSRDRFHNQGSNLNRKILLFVELI